MVWLWILCALVKNDKRVCCKRSAARQNVTLTLRTCESRDACVVLWGTCALHGRQSIFQTSVGLVTFLILSKGAAAVCRRQNHFEVWVSLIDEMRMHAAQPRYCVTTSLGPAKEHGRTWLVPWSIAFSPRGTGPTTGSFPPGAGVDVFVLSFGGERSGVISGRTGWEKRRGFSGERVSLQTPHHASDVLIIIVMIMDLLTAKRPPTYTTHVKAQDLVFLESLWLCDSV